MELVQEGGMTWLNTGADQVTCSCFWPEDPETFVQIQGSWNIYIQVNKCIFSCPTIQSHNPAIFIVLTCNGPGKNV